MERRRPDVWVLTRCYKRAVHLFDAEEVRGSNPLAPTIKGPGHKAWSQGLFLWGADRIEGLGRREVDEKLTRRVGDEPHLSAGPRDGPRKAGSSESVNAEG
jgi:hypothetical protein